MTDSDHRAGFTLQANILAHICGLSGSVNANISGLRPFISQLISTSFPHLTEPQVNLFVKGLFDLHSDQSIFQAHLKDFLIQLKSISGKEDLMEEDWELEKERTVKAATTTTMVVPGFIKPEDQQDDD